MLTSLIIKDIQIKTYNQNYLTPSEWPSSKKFTNNKCWRGCGEKEILPHCRQGCKLVQPLCRTAWRFLKKLKIELPYDPAISLLGIYPEKAIIQKDTCTPTFVAALFTVARTQQQSRCPLTDEFDKEVVVHIYNGILFRSELIMVKWMNLESVIQSEEVCQKQTTNILY